MSKHPVQPAELDKDGVLRFKKNAIVEMLLDEGRHDMNSIAARNFSDDDRTQFAQLIGYSVSGAEDLSYFNITDVPTADRVPGEFEPSAELLAKTLQQAIVGGTGVDTTATLAAASTSIAISLKRIADLIEGSPERTGLVEHLGGAIQDAILNAARHAR